MSSAVTRFEVCIPLPESDVYPNTYNAGQAFIASMTTLLSGGTSNKHLYIYEAYDTVSQLGIMIVMGFLTPAQTTTALGYLSTLASSMDSAYTPVMSVAWSATSEP